jgi:predicted ATPase
LISTGHTQSEELVALADKKATLLWHAIGNMNKGSILALTGKASAAVQTSVAGISEWRQTGGSLLLPWYLSNLAMAYGELGQFDDAWRSIGEAMTAVETTKETWCEAEVHRMAGEIALMSCLQSRSFRKRSA